MTKIGRFRPIAATIDVLSGVRRLARASLIAALLTGAGPALAADINATLHWSERVELSTPVSGVVQRVMVDVGSRVKKGTVLLSLDERSFKANLAEAQANLAEAKDALEEADREVKRGEELFKRTVLSIHELQLVKIDRTRAAARFSGAKTALTQARLNLDYSVVRSPYDAIVLARSVEPGQTVVTRLQATPLLTVARADRMVARAALDQAQIERLRRGSEIDVRIGGSTYKGKIVRLGMAALSAGQQPPLYALDVEFALPHDRLLRTGQAAVISLP